MKMKDLIDILKILFGGPVYFIGALAIMLVALSHYPEYNFITKYIVTLVLTH